MKRVKGKISASMMCAGLDKIVSYLTVFKDINLELLHLDIMDGSFVPNFAIGTDFARNLRALSNIIFDYHFLVKNPLEKMAWFEIKEGDQVSFHYEGNDKIQECLDFLTIKKAKIYITINPETDFMCLDKFLDQIDGIVVMTVYPGFAGKKIVPATIEKVKSLKKHLITSRKEDIEIEVDGNISIENAKKLYDAGATIFVAGSSSIFNSDEHTISERIENMRRAIGWE